MTCSAPSPRGSVDRQRGDGLAGGQRGQPARPQRVGSLPQDAAASPRTTTAAAGWPRRVPAPRPGSPARARRSRHRRTPRATRCRASPARTPASRGRPRTRRAAPRPRAPTRWCTCARTAGGPTPRAAAGRRRGSGPLHLHQALRGRPSPRWAMMFFCTSVVPAATVTGMLSSHWRCISPSRRQSGSSSSEQSLRARAPRGRPGPRAARPGCCGCGRSTPRSPAPRRRPGWRWRRSSTTSPPRCASPAWRAAPGSRDRPRAVVRRPRSPARTAPGAPARGWRARSGRCRCARTRAPPPPTSIPRPRRRVDRSPGSSASSKKISLNSLLPAMLGIGRTVIPGVRMSTRNIEMPPASSPRCWCAPGAGSGRRARRRSCSRSSGRSRRSGRRRARLGVFSDARSEPASGSENPWHHSTSPAAMRGRCRACWSGVPKRMISGPM